MKISDVAIYSAKLGGASSLLVRVDTDEGIYGWGEACLPGREHAVAGVIRHYREALVGRDPCRRGALWQHMYRAQYFEGGRDLAAAIAAVDMALHDIVGKRLQVPVYDLLGGRQREYAALLPAVPPVSVVGLVDQGRRLLEAGWEGILLKLPDAAPLDEVAAALLALRAAVGHNPVIGLDCGQRLSVADAASFCQTLEHHTLDFVQDPIRDDVPSSYRALRRLIDVPFAIGACLSSKWAFMPYLESDIANYARINVGACGGLTESVKVAASCEAHYVPVMPCGRLGPVGLAAQAHFALSLPSLAWVEADVTATFDSAVFPMGPEIDGSSLFVAESPGLGVDVAVSAVEEFPDAFPIV